MSANEILGVAWRVSKVSPTSRWICCDLERETNVPITHIGANHPEEVADMIAARIVLDHNKRLKELVR